MLKFWKWLSCIIVICNYFSIIVICNYFSICTQVNVIEISAICQEPVLYDKGGLVFGCACFCIVDVYNIS